MKEKVQEFETKLIQDEQIEDVSGGRFNMFIPRVYIPCKCKHCGKNYTDTVYSSCCPKCKAIIKNGG